MRKATQLPAVIPEAPLIRICTREDCDNKLAPHRKKYCSAVCKNIVMTGGLGSPGRPTLYRPEYATTKFDEYLKEVLENNEEKLIKGANGGWTVLNRSHLPTKEDYAFYLGVSSYTIPNWEEQYPAFARAMDLLIERQKQMLVSYGLAGRMAPGLVKMMLSQHGMIEKRDPVEANISILGIVRHLYEEVDKLEGGDDVKRTYGASSTS